MSEDLDYLLECHREATWDDPRRILRLAHEDDQYISAAACALVLNHGDPELHACDLAGVLGPAMRDFDLLCEDWAELATEHGLDPDPPLLHHGVAGLRVVGDDRYAAVVARLLEGSELEWFAAVLALGDDPSPAAERMLRAVVAERGDDAATASLINSLALARQASWARTAAALHIEQGWSRRQAASFLRVAGELIADSEDLGQYDDLVELAEDESLPRGLRHFALGYALSFDLEPEDDAEATIQRQHVHRVVALSKAGLVPLVESEVPDWFRSRVDAAVFD